MSYNLAYELPALANLHAVVEVCWDIKITGLQAVYLNFVTFQLGLLMFLAWLVTAQLGLAYNQSS